MHVRTQPLCPLNYRNPATVQNANPVSPYIHAYTHQLEKSKGDADNKQLAHSKFVLHVNRDEVLLSLQRVY